MKSPNELNHKIDKAFGSIEKLEKLAAPENTYEQVLNKISESKKTTNIYANYLRWAAVGLIILVNMLSYIKYQEQSNLTQYQVSDLVSDYGLDSYAYSEY